MWAYLENEPAIGGVAEPDSFGRGLLLEGKRLGFN